MARKELAHAALVIVDAQFDYLEAPECAPFVERFIDCTAGVLTAFRDAALPVVHVRTLVNADASDAMPHRSSAPRCVVGTRGAEVPNELREHEWEPVLAKSHFSAFDNPEFEGLLHHRGVETLVIAGAYTHACVRETAVAAYQRGFRVVIVDGAVISTDESHAAAAMTWMNGRVAEVRNSAAVIAGIARGGREWDDLGERVAAARDGATGAELSLVERSKILSRWADRIDAASKRFAKDISRAVNKPLVLAEDEVKRAISHIRTAADLPNRGFESEFEVAPGVTVRNEPVGVVALLMPWNNPLAIPAGKIAAAFLGGNGIVFKPSPLDGGIGALLVAEARAAGVVGLEIAENTHRVGTQLAWRDDVDALAITGSIEAGSDVARACAATGKVLQAELGGNNAAIVTPDADLEAVIPDLVRNAFVYSGQRCTAIRRWIVDESIAPEFMRRAVAEAEQFVANPLMGELISDEAASRVSAAIDFATSMGATRLTTEPRRTKRRVVPPTIVQSDDESSAIVQNELFGPVAVVQIARGLSDAVRLANGVRQGLLVAVCSTDQGVIDFVTRESRVGIVQIGGGPVPVHPDAPFGGWGMSGFGTPEHGMWDMQFYTRPRTVYDLSS